MNEFIPWYIGGPLIGLMVPILLILREKQLGVSSTYRYIGSLVFPRLPYFNYDRSNDLWQMHFALGIVASAVILFQFGGFNEIGAIEGRPYSEIATTIYSVSNWWIFLFGGFLIGFGSRYAGGCTAGHCIMGNSILSVGSMLSTVGFFVGGLFVTHFIIPLIF